MQPQRVGQVRCSAALGVIAVSLLLFPSPPGIVKTQRCTDGANPCQNRQGRFREQQSGKNGIDDPSDQIDVPGNLALSVHNCVGTRCHLNTPLVPVMAKGQLAGCPTNGGPSTNFAAISIVRACTRARYIAARRSAVLPRNAQASDNRSSVPARGTGSAKDSVPPP